MQDQMEHNLTDQQSLNDEFNLHFPTLCVVTISLTNDGSPPVLHIPEKKPIIGNYLSYIDSDISSDSN